jgi:hypothetical protein
MRKCSRGGFVVARARTRGHAVASLNGTKTQVRSTIASLLGRDPSGSIVEKVYHRLKVIAGITGFAGLAARSEKALDLKDVANGLKRLRNLIQQICNALRAHESGFQTALDMEILSQVIDHLSVDHTSREIRKARRTIESLKTQALSVARASQNAETALRGSKGKSGPKQLEWHDAYTAVLLELAADAGIPLQTGHGRKKGRPRWLFKAASAFEVFLPPQMRLGSAETRNKRLRRSQKRLLKLSGHNSLRK